MKKTKFLLLLFLIIIPVKAKAYEKYSITDFAFYDPISNSKCNETNYWTVYNQNTTCYRFIVLEDNDTPEKDTITLMLDHNIANDTYTNYQTILEKEKKNWTNYQGDFTLIDENTISKFMKLTTRPEISSENPDAISVNNNGRVYSGFMLNSYYYKDGNLTNYAGFWSKDLYPKDKNYAYTITEYGNNRLVDITQRRGIRPVITISKEKLNKSSSYIDISNKITKSYSYHYPTDKYDNYTYKQLQGFTITKDKLVFHSSNNSNPDKGLVISYSGEKFQQLYKIEYNNTGHGNDMTYNSKTNEVLLVGPNNHKEIFVYDATNMEHTRSYSSTNIETNYSAIGYDKYNDLYFGFSGQKIYVLDTNLKKMYSFDTKLIETTQGMEYHNGYIYLTTFEAGCPSTYQLWCLNTPFSSLTYVYNAKLNSDKTPSSTFGNLEKVFYIGPNIGELESISFDEKNVILGYATVHYDSKNTYQFYSTPLSVIKDKPDYKIDYLKEKDKTKITISSSNELSPIEGFNFTNKKTLEKVIKSTNKDFSINICDKYNNCNTEKIVISNIINQDQNEQNKQNTNDNYSNDKKSTLEEIIANPKTGILLPTLTIIFIGISSLIGITYFQKRLNN